MSRRLRAAGPLAPPHLRIWELSTLAAAWHRTYGGNRPDLARALEFHDRWLPGTMRSITGITRTYKPRCVMLRGPGDWASIPRIPLVPAPRGIHTPTSVR